jgi:hypothetical protein
MIGGWSREGTSSIAGEEWMRRSFDIGRVEFGIICDDISLRIVNKATVGGVDDSMSSEWKVIAGKLLAEGGIR